MRRYELAAYAIIHLPIIMMIGFCCAMTWPINIALIAICYAIGLTDLVYAKLPLIRQRVYCSFGPKPVPEQRRWAYFAGYKFIGVGLALDAIVILQSMAFSAVR